MTSLLSQISDNIQRLQPYQPGRAIGEVMLERGIKNIVKLASNENPLGAGRRAVAALAGLGSDTLARYPDANGSALREAISRRLNVAPECIVLGNGSNEILELAAHLMLHDGTAAVYADHAFIVYKLATATRRAEARVVKADNFAHDLPAMAAAADSPQVRLMFIANPNNPTGTWHPPAAIRALLQQAPPHVLVVLDEAYCEYAGSGSGTLALLEEFPNLLITRTFSKIHGLAALRAGYGIAAAGLVEMLNRIRQPFNMNAAAQLAATAALEDAPHIANSIRTNQEGMKTLTAALDKRSISYIPSFGNFITFHAASGADALYEKLLGGGIIARQLHEYNMGDWLRLTVGTAEQNEQFIRLLPVRA